MNPRYISHFTRIRIVAIALCYLLVFPPTYWSASRSKPSKSDSMARPTAAPPKDVTRILKPLLLAQSLGVVLTPLNTSFNGHTGISHHQPSNKVLSTAFYSSGQPNNFELIAGDGTHAAFSNVAGISGELRIESARNNGQGTSIGGFTTGEVFTGSNMAGVIARISAAGSSIQNPWVVLPDENGSLNGGLHLDRTGVFGGDLIAVTTVGGVWRITESGQATRIANLNTALKGVTVVSNEPERYGPWAGKILTGARTQGGVYAIDNQGSATFHHVGIDPEDITIIPAHENFYGVDPSDQKIWGAPAAAFSSMIGDVLIAQQTPGILSRAHWNGTEFEIAQIAQVPQWRQITFSPSGISPISPVRQVHEQIAIVRHAPIIDSGRIEGALWQLTGESLTLDGTDVITSDLLVPGSPTVSVSGSANFEGTIEGQENTQPSDHTISITGNATLRHLITRTNPTELEAVAAPPAPAGTRDVALNQAGQSAGDWTTLRNLTLTGKAGSVAVPPGTYGAFAASGRNSFILGVANSTEPTVYNLERLSLAGGSDLILAGPIVLTVKDTVTMVGSTVGAADNPRLLILKISSNSPDAVKLSGTSVLYAITRAPAGIVTVEGHARLRGTVSCDQLIVRGSGVIQITESDLPPPPVDRPPTVNAGPDQTITLPINTVALNGTASDDGLPQGSTLSVLWSKVSGPGTVTFSDPTSLVGNATFSTAGTFVLRLTANDSLLTSSDEMTVSVLSHNQRPVVNAGADKIISLPNTATLNGSVSDDGLPSGSSVSINWSKTSGPGDVTFANTSAPITTASFSVAGTYTLRLTANDTEFEVTDEAVVVVGAANEPPTVNAGSDQTIRLPINTVTLTGATTDDGLPANSNLTFLWTLVSGPAAVSFSNPTAPFTTATLNEPGIYLLRFSVGDSQATSFDEVVITVNPQLINRPPTVDAGLDQSTTLLTAPVSYAGDFAGFQASTGAPPIAISFDDIAAGTNITGTTISGVTFQLEGSATQNAPLIVVNGHETFTPSGYSGIIDATKNKLFPTSGENVLSPGGVNLHPTDPLLQNDNIKMTFSQPVTAVGFDLLFQEMDFASFVSLTVIGSNGQTLHHNSSLPTGVNFGGGHPGGPVFVGFVSSLPNISAIILHDGDGNGVNPDSNIGIDSIRLVPSIPSGGGVGLHGSVSDDQLPDPPATVSSLWTKVSGPGTVTFGTPSQLDTTASFSAVGTYVLRLTANDSQLTATDDVTVVVNAVNHSPVVSAGLNRTITLPTNSLTLGGSVSDDGLPAGSPLVISWSKVTGPGTVTFGNPNAASSSATFSASGTYVLRLTASDGQYSNFSHVAIGVLPAPSGTPTPTPTPTPDPSASPTPTPTPTPTPVNSISPGWIGGPINRSIVSGFVPIVVGQGINLTQGMVQYWPESNPAEVRVLTTTGQGGPGTIIATLDTTTIANDSYVIRLTGLNGTQATNLSSSNSSNETAVNADDDSDRNHGPNAGDEVIYPASLQSTEVVSQVTVMVAGENKPGRLTLTSTDFAIPLAGLPITIGRTYDSLERGRVGDFGHGWSLSVGSPRLEVNAAKDVTLTLQDNRRVTFFFAPRSFGGIVSWLHQSAYTPEPGFHGSLISDGCPLMLRLGGQFLCTLSTTSSYEPTVYQYTDPEGREFVITADGILRSIKDLRGNQLNFNHNGITSNSGGLNVPFERDSLGRIARLTDPEGNAWNYEYDVAGNLHKVTLPGIATPITYSYDSNHLYTGMLDPRGNVAVTRTYYPDGRLEAVTDAAGNTTSYAYDLTNNATTVTNPDGGITVLRYDNFGQLLSETDPLGRITSFTYDPQHNLLSETNALGQVTRYTYDEGGNQTSVTDPAGKISRVTYNDFGGPATMTDALGNVRTIHYDANFSPISVSDALGTFAAFTVDQQGNPITFTDANGATTRLTYDAHGNLLTRTDPLNHVIANTYDQAGRLLTLTDPRGNVTTNSYDSLGRLVTVSDALDHITRYEYDANSNKSAMVDALGRRTTYTYDAANRLIRTTYSDNTSVSYTYNFRDQKLSETDQSGRVTTYTYDLAGQLSKMKYPDDAEVNHAYDAIGRETALTDERGNTTRYEYDPACGCRERMTKVTDALNRSTVFKFDAAGRLISIVDAATRETRLTYDIRNGLILVTYPDGTTTRRTYDPAGHQLSRTDQAGRLTRYSYDAAGELLSVIDALDQATVYTYDPAGNLLSIRDANNHTTQFEYDVLDRVIKRTLPLGMNETLAYDEVGSLKTRTDFNGKQITYAYDSLDRLVSKTPDATLGEPTISFTYTATGERATMVDAPGTTTYTYNNRDRLTSKATPQGTLNYTYDPTGNVLSLRSSNPNGASVNYSYDALNRLHRVVDNRLNAGTTTYTYNAVDNLIGEQSANGVQSTLSYDAVDNLTNLTINRGGVLASYAYTYNGAGQRLSANEQNGRRVSYSYDPLGRLTTESIVNDPNPNSTGTLSYSLDAVGNRLARTSTLAALPSTAASYDANDRLTSDSYDANGNTKTSNGASFGYNFENRLTSLSPDTTFVYDGNGNRVAKIAAGVTTRYLVDELNPTGYAQVIEEVVGGSAQRTYTYGSALLSQNEISSNRMSFYGSDGHGSVRLLTDTAGEITDTYDYDAFGNIVNAFGSTPNDYLYSGERFDPAAGAYHLRERYYNPQRGRFLTTDPFPGFLEEPPTQNDYSYVGGDPANLVDPSGLTETFEKVYLRAQIAIRPALPCFRALPATALPLLAGTYLKAFDGPVRTRTFKPGDKIYRTPWPREKPNRPGPWFGTRRTATSAGTESLSNVKKWGNPVNRLRTFVFTKEVTVYYGKVAGGKGYQVLFPKNINPCSVLKLVADVALR
jgi:RHS repeat-associated protein